MRDKLGGGNFGTAFEAVNVSVSEEIQDGVQQACSAGSRWVYTTHGHAAPQSMRCEQGGWMERVTVYGVLERHKRPSIQSNHQNKSVLTPKTILLRARTYPAYPLTLYIRPAPPPVP